MISLISVYFNIKLLRLLIISTTNNNNNNNNNNNLMQVFHYHIANLSISFP
jgi:hypothetical protein